MDSVKGASVVARRKRLPNIDIDWHKGMMKVTCQNGRGCDAMKLTLDEINHILFLSQVATDNNRLHMLREIIQCLVYIVKARGEIEVPDEVGAHVREIIARIEGELREDTERLREIQRNLGQFGRRSPLG